MANAASAATKGRPFRGGRFCHFARGSTLKVNVIPSGERSHDFASSGSSSDLNTSASGPRLRPRNRLYVMFGTVTVPPEAETVGSTFWTSQVAETTMTPPGLGCLAGSGKLYGY